MIMRLNFIWSVLTCLIIANVYGQQHTNIVFILADDLGYSDVGYIGAKPDIHTPNIDSLAGEGLVFTDAYASAPVCSPTRASIVTGKYPATLQLTCHIPGIGMEPYLERVNQGHPLKEAEFKDHLPLEELTFAEVLASQGYVTGFMGKWHLAGAGSQKTTDGIVDEKFHPDRQGFQTNVAGCAYGQPHSYFSPYRNATLPDGPPGEYLTDRMGNEAVNFIEKNKASPFLLYLSTYTIHTPYQVPEDLTQQYNGNKRLAMIDKLDQNVGKVMRKIRELGLEDHTLVIFYSDNGGTKSNAPLRSAKGSLYEGGIRVPLIFCLPGAIEHGNTDLPVSSPDLFPTILEAANISPDRFPDLEGVSLWKHLIHREPIEDRALYWHFPHHRDIEKSMAAAMRKDRWKLIREFESGTYSLYDLKSDIAEENDLADQYPDKVADMRDQLNQWLENIKANMPQPNAANGR